MTISFRIKFTGLIVMWIIILGVEIYAWIKIIIAQVKIRLVNILVHGDLININL